MNRVKHLHPLASIWCIDQIDNIDMRPFHHLRARATSQLYFVDTRLGLLTSRQALSSSGIGSISNTLHKFLQALGSSTSVPYRLLNCCVIASLRCSRALSFSSSSLPQLKKLHIL